MLGVDLWNGTPAQVQQFKNSTGTTYPLLMLGGSATGGDLNTLYGGVPAYDNYAVINKQGIVRYYASTLWAHGNRYQLDQIRGAVDSLVSTTVDVPLSIGPALSLTGAPNPFREALSVDVRVPPGADGGDVPVTVTLHDLRGRRVATLFDGIAAGGAARVVFRLDGAGSRMTAGAYWLRAASGGTVVTRRVVALQ